MTETANILLRLAMKMDEGSYADVVAGINILREMSGVITGIIAKSDENLEMMKRVNMATIDYANAQSKAQIGTIELAKSMNLVQQAGGKLSKEDFALLSKAAVEFSDATGRSASEAMDELTAAFIRGSDKGLKPYGIEIDKTSSKADAHKQIMEQLRKKYGDVNIEIDNMSDGVAGVKNNFQAFWMSIYDGMDRVGNPFVKLLSLVTDKLEDAATALNKLNKAQKDYLWSSQFLADAINQWSPLADDSQKQEAKDRMLGYLTGGKLGDISFDQPPENSSESVSDFSKMQTRGGGGGGGGGKKNKNQFEIGIGEEAVEMFPWIHGPSIETWESENDIYKNFGDVKEALTFINENFGQNIDLQKEAMDLLGPYWEFQSAEISNLEAINDLEEKRGYVMLDQIKKREAQKKAEIDYYNSTEGMAQRLSDIVETISDGWSQARRSFDMIHQAYTDGTKGMSKAAATMYYIDASIQTVIETARALASFAQRQYAEGALHLASAATYITAMAVAAANGGSGASGSSSVSAVGPSATAGRYSGGYDRDARNDTLNITLTLDKSAAGWAAIAERNSRSARAGGRSFYEAA